MAGKKKTQKTNPKLFSGEGLGFISPDCIEKFLFLTHDIIKIKSCYSNFPVHSVLYYYNHPNKALSWTEKNLSECTDLKVTSTEVVFATL